MSCYIQKDLAKLLSGDADHGTLPLLNAEHGCTNGCTTGISYYGSAEYLPPAAHEDQEGFYVISGLGWAKVGEEEFSLSPGLSFIAPAGVRHQMKSSIAGEPVVLFWFHAQA